MRPPSLRAGLAAVGFTLAATSPAALPETISTTSAALAYVLAVVGASATGGLWAGLGASILSFLALNFFFTPPRYTLAVDKPEDLVALVVFLLVSAIVGSLLARTVAQRARAEHREREAVLLQHLSTRLLSGEPVPEILGSFSRAVTDLFDLASCEVTTRPEGDQAAARSPTRTPPGEPEVIPLMAGERQVGSVRVVPRPGQSLTPEGRGVIRTFAGQMGLALEGMRLAEDAAEARLDAETNRLRAALFSSVTHDLRTPLATITASVTSLMDPEAAVDPEGRRELLETIHQEAERLNRLVGNLLDLSRIRAGALIPAKAPAAVEEVLEGVVGRLQPILDGHPVRLVVREDLPELPIDVMQIDQVLTNILENAARFSPPGTPISLYAARWQDSVEVRVADQGPGIPSGLTDRVFEPFVRGEASAGTGLGLSIARAIVESHGGRIWIEGTPGGGTTVVFELPLKT